MFVCDDTNTGIYCIFNKESNKRYIGQAKNLHKRCNSHRNDLYSQIHFNDYLQKAFNLHGEEAFEFIVLEHCTLEELNERERYYITLYNTKDRDCGYNLKDGGQDCNTGLCEESRKKLSKSICKSYENPLRREKQSQAAKEFWSRPEYRKGHSGKNAPMYGHHHTDEVKKRISDLHKGISVNAKYHDKVLCVETGQIFDNARVASRELSLDSSCIVKVCKGERYTCGGYHWQFVSEDNIGENKVS